MLESTAFVASAQPVLNAWAPRGRVCGVRKQRALSASVSAVSLRPSSSAFLRGSYSLVAAKHGAGRSELPSMSIVDEAKLLDMRAEEVFMPALSSTMTSGTIVQWLKSPGDRVEKDEMVMVVTSDKADMEVCSFANGWLASILVEEGEEADCGATVALIAKREEDIENIAECGLECIVSGSGNRHDGTTVVDSVDAASSPASSSSGASSESNSGAASAGASASAVAPGAAMPAGTKEIFMPALSSTMVTGKIDEFFFEIGDEVKKGDIVMAVESDKSSMDSEAWDNGWLSHIVIDVGEEGKCGEPVAYLAATEADIPAVQAWASAQGSGGAAASQAAPAAAAQSAPAQVAPAPSTPSAAPVVNTGRIIASPYAKKQAEALAVDLSRVVGTGPGGRIVVADVAAAAAAGGASTSAAAPAAAGGAPVTRTDGKVVATPDAKKVAKKEKIDLATVTGTGNFGRVTVDDVLKAAGKEPVAKQASTAPVAAAAGAGGARGVTEANAAPTPVPEGAVAMTATQKAVVQNMNASLDVPVFRVAYSIKTAAFDELYAKLKPKGVTVSALLAKACAITIQKHPIMNAAYKNNSILYRPQANIAMAVSTPDGGLMTPVLKDASEVDLYSLSRTWKDLVKRTMAGQLKADEYNSGTFFVSNLGMFGVSAFDAILPPGAPSILAVSASKPVVALQPNGLVGVHKEMSVNITCDHRHIYGAQAAEFLRDLADLIENDVQSLLM